MISDASAAALQRIAQRADDLRHAYEPGFEPADARAPRSNHAVAALDPLSVAAPRGYWFAFTGPDGIRFGRDGGFTLVDGALRSRDGAEVLGFAASSGQLGTLHVDPIDAALGRASDPRLEADGTFTYARAGLDPRTGARRSDRVEAGRIALVRFPAGSEPLRADATHVLAPPGVAPRYGRPGEAEFPALETHARDLGAVDPQSGVRRLQEAYLSFEALQAAERQRRGFDRIAGDLIK
jgi:flagellar basal body rod protein FlgG